MLQRPALAEAMNIRLGRKPCTAVLTVEVHAYEACIEGMTADDQRWPNARLEEDSVLKEPLLVELNRVPALSMWWWNLMQTWETWRAVKTRRDRKSLDSPERWKGGVRML